MNRLMVTISEGKHFISLPVKSVNSLANIKPVRGAAIINVDPQPKKNRLRKHIIAATGAVTAAVVAAGMGAWITHELDQNKATEIANNCNDRNNRYSHANDLEDPTVRHRQLTALKDQYGFSCGAAFYNDIVAALESSDATQAAAAQAALQKATQAALQNATEPLTQRIDAMEKSTKRLKRTVARLDNRERIKSVGAAVPDPNAGYSYQVGSR